MSQEKAPLSRLFAPKTIAVVGASASPEKPGYQMMKSLEGFSGTVYPINPRAGDILGHTAYPDIASLPEPADLVALLVPPRASADILKQAAEHDAGSALMISGGFGETGEDGRALQDEIAGICREGRIRLLGPNTSGFIVPPIGLCATFLPPAAEIAPGGIGIVAQSGGINLTLALLAHAEGLGLSMAVGLGNAADVGMAEAVDYLAADDGTSAILVHLEGVPDGRRLYEVIRAAARKKPVIALPVGRADLGGFAESHTGNLMGSFELTRAMLRQAGAVVVDTTDDAVDAAHLLSAHRLAPSSDPGIGILTGQAGPGLLMTDVLRTADVSVPEVAPETVARIGALLPPMTFIRNPVDTGRPLESFGKVLFELSQDAAIDAILVYALLEAGVVDPITHFEDMLTESDKPVIYATHGVPSQIGPVLRAFEGRGVPAFASPDRAARAMRSLVEDSRAAWLAAQDEAGPVAPAAPLAGPLDEDAAKALIEAVGIPTPARHVCATHAEAEVALAALNGSPDNPVVVKVLDASVTHKTEIGGVHVGVDGPDALKDALAKIDAIPGETGSARRYLVEAMAPPGLEVIIGAVNDPSYGPTVLLGLGGIAAEALGDVSRRLAPTSPAQAAAMISELRGKALFDGWRGAPPVDREALADAVVKIAALMAGHPEIRELDLNPVRVYPDGLLALDALVVV